MNNHNYYINAIRSIGLQSIVNAKQGHPGMTISAAPLTYSLYLNNINISNSNPHWFNRDRFVLSAGHGSMCLYPIFYLSKYVDIEKLKNFRTKILGFAGHPENINFEYIDATTGPLGQGLSNAVGMAIAESYLRNKFYELKGLVDHYTYVIVGDGDLQEGISYESMSLAGKLKLNKLIVLHDSNKQQLESSVDLVNSENLKLRMESMNWNYFSCKNDYDSINSVIQIAKNQSDKPTFIEVDTIIGEGLNEANSFNAHGFSLKESDLDKFLKYFKCEEFKDWNVGSNVFDYFYENVNKRGEKAYQNWLQLLEHYKNTNSKQLQIFLNQINDLNKIDLTKIIDINKLPKNNATRSVAGWILKQIQSNDINLFNEIITISPDISKSTNITISQDLFNNNHKNNMIFGGIREFSIMGIQNGIQLHGGIKSITSAFLAFSDYMKPALRLAAISEINPIVIYTHDSILIGSDGPTHQPIEQIGTLRSIPNLNVFRPCDELETLASFQFALNSKNEPTSIILSRQNLKSFELTKFDQTINFGGYLLTYNSDTPDITIVASGSEIELAIETMNYLYDNFKITSEIYSVPNLNKFITQDNLTNLFKNKYGLVSIEASNDYIWYKLAELSKSKDYINISINQFGYSIDGEINYKYFGFNIINISKKIITKWFNDNSNWVELITNLSNELNESFKEIE